MSLVNVQIDNYKRIYGTYPNGYVLTSGDGTVQGCDFLPLPEVNEVPNGGTTNQVLSKIDNQDNNTQWRSINEVPNGGTVNQVLYKIDSQNNNTQWRSINEVPNGGTTNQFLKKTSNLDNATSFGNIQATDLPIITGWKDLVSDISISGVPGAQAPTPTAFPTGALREEYVFDIGDYVYLQPFHINHDLKIGGKAYLHVHWSTSGTQLNTVRWEFQVSRALGHNQQNFALPVSYFVTQAPNGTPWRHYVAEVSLADSLTLIEPDELILVTLRRVTNGGTNNTDLVYGLCADIHYESDRDTTINKAPNFFG